MRTYEPCTTQAKTKLHWSTKLDNPKHLSKFPGRAGRTLCGNFGMDEARANHLLGQWSNKRITVLELPECKSCARSKAGDQGATPSRPKLSGGEPR